MRTRKINFIFADCDIKAVHISTNTTSFHGRRTIFYHFLPVCQHIVTVPISLRFRAGRKRLIFQGNDSLEIDPLAMNLARAYRWQALIDSGTYSNTIELADAIGKDPAYVSRLIRLTLLAPEIVHVILAGTLQKTVSLETLRKELPVRWSDQKKLFGVE